MSSPAIRFSDLGPVYLVCGKTDIRQGIDSEKYITYLLEKLPNE